MINLNPQMALGGTLSLKGMGETHMGVHGRLRWWLDRDWAVDISPGVLFLGNSNDDRYDLQYPTVSGRIGLNYGDWIGITGGFELVRIEDDGSEMDWFAGAHIGYYPGAIAGVFFAVLSILVSSNIASPS